LIELLDRGLDMALLDVIDGCVEVLIDYISI
jgi:hypothetical protein